MAVCRTALVIPIFWGASHGVLGNTGCLARWLKSSSLNMTLPRVLQKNANGTNTSQTSKNTRTVKTTQDHVEASRLFSVWNGRVQPPNDRRQAPKLSYKEIGYSTHTCGGLYRLFGALALGLCVWHLLTHLGSPEIWQPRRRHPTFIQLVNRYRRAFTATGRSCLSALIYNCAHV